MTNKPSVILIGADKGGVGKTTVSRALSDYAQARHSGARLFDSEFPSGDLARFAPADIIDISKVRDQMRVFDDVTGVTLVDIRAGQLSPVLRALDEAMLLDDVRAGALGLALVHVLGPTDRSIREIAETAAVIGAGVKHYLVTNHINEGGFAEWKADSRFSAKLAMMESVTINVPHLTAEATDVVQRIGGSFASFTRDTSHSRMLRGLVRSWMDAVWREFDRVGLGELIASAIG
jgi:hypothetical protein